MKFVTDKHNKRKGLTTEEGNCLHTDAGAHFHSAVRKFCGLFISCFAEVRFLHVGSVPFISLKVFNIGAIFFF